MSHCGVKPVLETAGHPRGKCVCPSHLYAAFDLNFLQGFLENRMWFLVREDSQFSCQPLRGSWSPQGAQWSWRHPQLCRHQCSQSSIVYLLRLWSWLHLPEKMPLSTKVFVFLLNHEKNPPTLILGGLSPFWRQGLREKVCVWKLRVFRVLWVLVASLLSLAWQGRYKPFPNPQGVLLLSLDIKSFLLDYYHC